MKSVNTICRPKTSLIYITAHRLAIYCPQKLQSRWWLLFKAFNIHILLMFKLTYCTVYIFLATIYNYLNVDINLKKYIYMCNLLRTD